jgi:ribonuclease P protein component
VSKQFTLGKKERLKSRKQIEQLFKEGNSISISPFRVYFLINQMLNAQRPMFNVQFGTGVSGKSFRKAVDRNRIKRLIREAWRLQNLGLKEKLKAAGLQMHVFFIYTGKEMPGYKLVSEKVKTAIEKLIKTIG